MTYDCLATIIIDYRSKIDFELIKINLNEKLEEFKNNLELIIIFNQKNNVNELIDKLNVNVPITVIESSKLLPILENIGLGDVKFLINEFSISQLANNYKTDNICFLGRRANIFFN